MKLPCRFQAESISTNYSINSLLYRYQKHGGGVNNLELGSAFVNAYVWTNKFVRWNLFRRLRFDSSDCLHSLISIGPKPIHFLSRYSALNTQSSL